MVEIHLEIDLARLMDGHAEAFAGQRHLFLDLAVLQVHEVDTRDLQHAFPGVEGGEEARAAGIHLQGFPEDADLEPVAHPVELFAESRLQFRIGLEEAGVLGEVVKTVPEGPQRGRHRRPEVRTVDELWHGADLTPFDGGGHMVAHDRVREGALHQWREAVFTGDAEFAIRADRFLQVLDRAHEKHFVAKSLLPDENDGLAPDLFRDRRHPTWGRRW